MLRVLGCDIVSGTLPSLEPLKLAVEVRRGKRDQTRSWQITFGIELVFSVTTCD